MFNFLSNLFSSDPEKKEEQSQLGAQKKHNQRIASKQLLTDEWHPVNFPYQATIFNIQRANKGYGSICQISVRYIENGQYKDMICLVNPKVKSFSFSNYHDIKPEDVADAPAFKDVWPKLEPYFTGKNVITYYADSHLRSLQATLKKNHIPEPEMRFIDLYDYFCERHDSWESLSLDYVAERLDLDSYPSAKYPIATLDTITEILELMYEKRPGILRKLLNIKVK
ncbi:exonuclease domain-containing protein [uncultured Dialister sp.]|uniref:exonuclease domain-containing protein n=1 Tax=uncultured Dialister sp. TaxID=278064 RepID=UPI0027DAF499|nr:exonuclease domain-containing protein [uncultured Dialister sp.]